MAEVRTYTIEVCAVCGGQLSNRFASSGLGGSDPGTGRCGNDRSHWRHGGVLIEVQALPAARQPTNSYYPGSRTMPGLVEAGAIPEKDEAYARAVSDVVENRDQLASAFRDWLQDRKAGT